MKVSAWEENTAPIVKASVNRFINNTPYNSWNQGMLTILFDTAEELNAQRAACESKGETFMYNAISRKNMKNSLTMSAEEVKTLLDSGQTT